jgi:hypothetical protein
MKTLYYFMERLVWSKRVDVILNAILILLTMCVTAWVIIAIIYFKEEVL